jgi:hypothetical protein
MTWIDVLDVAAKFSIVLGVASYLHQRRALRLQHERARREKAMVALAEYSRSLTPRSSAARKLVRRLDTAQIDNLEEGREFTIQQEHRDLLLAALPDHVTEDQLPREEAMSLTRNQSYLLRWEIVSKLNSCEVLAQYWLSNVGDQRMIENQLEFLLGEVPGDNILTTCRRLAEAKYFPGLHALIKQLERRRAPGGAPVNLETPWWKRLFDRVFYPDA